METIKCDDVTNRNLVDQRLIMGAMKRLAILRIKKETIGSVMKLNSGCRALVVYFKLYVCFNFVNAFFDNLVDFMMISSSTPSSNKHFATFTISSSSDLISNR